MELNLHWLFPEWILCGFLVLMLLREIIITPGSKKSSVELWALAAPLAALIGLIPIAGQMGSAFGGMYIADPFSAFFKIFFALTAFVVIVSSREFCNLFPERKSEYFLILLCTLIGLFILSSANDFLLLFVSLEVITLSFYILTSYAKKELLSIEAGLKYLIIGSLASAFVVYGISLIYLAAGSTSFPAVREIFTADPHNQLMLIGLFMIIAGIGFKVAAFPFQFWVPDVYEGAPTPVVSFLSVGSKAAGFAALLRILFTVFPAFQERSLLLSTLAALTLLYGNLGALVQTNIKRLFGYSSIGHAGYLLIALAAGSHFSASALLYYLVAYGITTLAVFLILTLCGLQLGSDSIQAYRGLGKSSPVIAGCLFLALLSSAGVPPLAGFAGKFLVLLAAVEAHLSWLALLGALMVAVSLYYYLALVRTMYFEEPLATTVTVKAGPLPQWVLFFLSAAIILVGIFQAPVLNAANRAASYLF